MATLKTRGKAATRRRQAARPISAGPIAVFDTTGDDELEGSRR